MTPLPITNPKLQEFLEELAAMIADRVWRELHETPDDLDPAE